MIATKKYKICRRLGSGVYEKCQTQKFILSQGRRARASKITRRKRISDYGLQLIEKQKVRFSYGVSEKQFRNYVDKAMTARKGTPADNLFQLLEHRLDNVIFRLGLATSRSMARQMVSHGHFIVNSKRTTVPSFNTKTGDVISVREGSKQRTLFLGMDKKTARIKSPSWIKWDSKALTANITGQPSDPDTFLSFDSVIEFYTR